LRGTAALAVALLIVASKDVQLRGAHEHGESCELSRPKGKGEGRVVAVRYRSVEVGQVRQGRVSLRHEMHELAALPAAVVGLWWRRADPELGRDAIKSR